MKTRLAAFAVLAGCSNPSPVPIADGYDAEMRCFFGDRVIAERIAGGMLVERGGEYLYQPAGAEGGRIVPKDRCVVVVSKRPA